MHEIVDQYFLAWVHSLHQLINQLITKFTSFATLQDVNGWPLRVIAQYYQVVLNMAPLPWQKSISKPYWTAQFKHKLNPPKPAELPYCELPQAEAGAELSQPPEAAASVQVDDPSFAQGYCKSFLAKIDTENGISQAINQLKAIVLGPDVSNVEGLEAILSQKLLLVEEAYQAQDATMQRVFKDAEKMSKEQDVLTEFRLGILAAQERIHAFLAKKKEEEEMEKAQEELRKVKEQQADQILSQMEAIGLRALLELHQRRQNDAQQPIPFDQVSEPPGLSKKPRIEKLEEDSGKCLRMNTN